VTLPGWMKKLFTVDDTVLDNQFVLLKDNQSDADGNTDENTDTNASASGSGNTDAKAANAPVSPAKVKNGSVKPMPLEQFIEHGNQKYNEEVRTAEPNLDDHLPVHLEEDQECIKRIFHLPQNKDIVIREFSAGTDRPWKGMIVFVDGMADKKIINEFILQPLMVLTHVTDEDPKRRMEVVSDKLLPGNQVECLQKWSKVVPGILSGSTAVFLDGCDAALIVETKGWEHRTVGPAQTENVVRGPHDGFTESFRANTGLVRSRLRSEHLITEMFSIGELGRTDVAVMYIEGLTNPALVEEVRKRIEAIDVDYLPDSGSLEQFIEDKPFLLIPQVLSTERPDRVAHMLTEGHVGIFVGNSPFAIVAPVVLWTLVHTPEDAYLRWQFGTFLRFLRWVALGVALLMPAFYVAVTNYHPEMIPTDLMLAIAGSREQVPFPVVVEILLMEFAIELIREAGIRIPSVIGPTIGIVELCVNEQV
jgi:spore germination protein KA